MLKRVGDEVYRLFEDQLTEPVLASKTADRAEAIELVRRRRNNWDQDIAYGARPFVLCGLPMPRLPLGTNRYTRRNGRFFLDVVGHPEFGVPFGMDRLILIWVATTAVRRQSPVVEFESGSQILKEWGMQLNGSHYHRVAAGFKRVFGSTIFFGTQDERQGAAVCGLPPSIRPKWNTNSDEEKENRWRRRGSSATSRSSVW